jgi:hypothetical protein
MSNVKTYNCYSLKLMSYLVKNGQKPVYDFILKDGRTCFVFDKTPQFCELLDKWDSR